MALILVVSIATWWSMRNLKFPPASASTTAPTAPIAADSVGVAMPANTVPNTINTNASAGTIALNATQYWTESGASLLGMAGAASFLMDASART